MVFLEMLGGTREYASFPVEAKTICKGLRKDLLKKAFPDARALRDHLETFEWVTDAPEDCALAARREVRNRSGLPGYVAPIGLADE